MIQNKTFPNRLVPWSCQAAAYVSKIWPEFPPPPYCPPSHSDRITLRLVRQTNWIKQIDCFEYSQLDPSTVVKSKFMYRYCIHLVQGLQNQRPFSPRRPLLKAWAIMSPQEYARSNYLYFSEDDESVLDCVRYPLSAIGTTAEEKDNWLAIEQVFGNGGKKVAIMMPNFFVILLQTPLYQVRIPTGVVKVRLETEPPFKTADQLSRSQFCSRD